jgi:hypothetical protein
MSPTTTQTMHDFCTYFDHRYAGRALAMVRSLRRHCPGGFRLWCLCMSPTAFDLLTKLNWAEIKPIRLEDFERGDADLLAAKANRKLVEFYFTCTPSLPLYVFKQDPSISDCTYVDADLFFYSDITPLFDELGENSVAIIAHRYPPALKHLEPFGRYNVGLLIFRRDQRGLAVLDWWRTRCNEWCYDKLEGDRYADQKYLDTWLERFPGVIELQHKGANVGPWNVSAHPVTIDGENVMIGDQPLIFYHFHGFKKVARGVFSTALAEYKTRATAAILRGIYAPYVREFDRAEREVTVLIPTDASKPHLRSGSGPVPAAWPRRVGRWGMKYLRLWRGLVLRYYVPVLYGKLI